MRHFFAALTAWCVAAGCAATCSLASAPAPPRNCGAPVTATPSNTTATPLPGLAVTTSTIAVSGLQPVLGDVDVLTTITTAVAADLDLTVTSPAGTTVTLTTDNGGVASDVFAGTRWDDDAAPGGIPTATAVPMAGNVQTHPYVSGQAAALLTPEEPLGAFIGENPNGTWTLTASIDDAVGTGSLQSWGLDLQSLAAEPTPLSASSYTVSPGSVISAAAPSVVTSEIEAFGESPYLGSVAVTMNLLHTQADDPQIALTSPGGTTVFLSTGVFASGGGADNVFAGTTWRDTANPGGQLPYFTNAGLTSDHPFTSGVVATPLAPSEGLAALRGEDANGIWRLTVADQFAGNGGSLASWTLLLTPARCLPPDTSITSGPAEGSTVASPDAVFTFAGAPSGATAGFTCSLDGAPFTPCGSSKEVRGLAIGQHTLEVAAVADDPGPSPASRTWTVAAPAPPPASGGSGSGTQPGGSGGTPPAGSETPPAGSGTPAAAQPLTVSAFTVAPKQPRAGKALTFRWLLSAAGTVTVELDRRVRGRFRPAGRTTVAAAAGGGSLKLKGRIGTTRLKAGSYRARITATSSGQAGTSPPQTLRFAIRR